jgi:DNA-binding FrmR family transcriptional regulator
MSEASGVAGMMRQAAAHAESASGLMAETDNNITDVLVQLNALTQMIDQLLRSELKTLSYVRNSRDTASATAAGMSNRAVLSSITQLNSIDWTIEDDVKKLAGIKQQIETIRTVISMLHTSVVDDRRFVIEARNTFNGVANALE